MSGYEADDQRYQDMLCAQYRQAQMSVRSEDGILDPEIAEHVDLLVAQLQDANRRILGLEADFKFQHACLMGWQQSFHKAMQALKETEAELEAERAKTAAIIKAAAATPQIPEAVEEESFPIRALGYSWGTK